MKSCAFAIFAAAMISSYAGDEVYQSVQITKYYKHSHRYIPTRTFISHSNLYIYITNHSNRYIPARTFISHHPIYILQTIRTDAFLPVHLFLNSILYTHLLYHPCIRLSYHPPFIHAPKAKMEKAERSTCGRRHAQSQPPKYVNHTPSKPLPSGIACCLAAAGPDGPHRSPAPDINFSMSPLVLKVPRFHHKQIFLGFADGRGRCEKTIDGVCVGERGGDMCANVFLLLV